MRGIRYKKISPSPPGGKIGLSSSLFFSSPGLSLCPVEGSLLPAKGRRADVRVYLRATRTTHALTADALNAGIPGAKAAPPPPEPLHPSPCRCTRFGGDLHAVIPTGRDHREVSRGIILSGMAAADACSGGGSPLPPGFPCCTGSLGLNLNV